jgi:hypothetical protein
MNSSRLYQERNNVYVLSLETNIRFNPEVNLLKQHIDDILSDDKIVNITIHQVPENFRIESGGMGQLSRLGKDKKKITLAGIKGHFAHYLKQTGFFRDIKRYETLEQAIESYSTTPSTSSS